MNSQLIEKILHIGEDCLKLPNSVDLFSDSSIVIADGGNNRICHYDPRGELLQCVGGEGFGEYRFKEPVGAFVSPDDEVFVLDWHNHRIVVYDKNFNYLTEFGHYGDTIENNIWEKIKSIITFHYKLPQSGLYYRNWSPNKTDPDRRNSSKIKNIKFLFSGLYYWYMCRNTSVKRSIEKLALNEEPINKPNGVAFMNDSVYISQKNNRCLSILDKNGDEVVIENHVFSCVEGEKFGRLGNLYKDPNSNLLFICDPENDAIWITDSDGTLKNSITSSDISISHFSPFSCVTIDGLLIVSGITNLLVISMDDMKLIYKEQIRQSHGVSVDRDNNWVYAVERADDRICKYKIDV